MIPIYIQLARGVLMIAIDPIQYKWTQENNQSFPKFIKNYII